MDIDITHQSGTWPDVQPLIKAAVEETLALLSEKPQALDVSIVLTDDTHIQDLNKTYRAKDKPTNVLSFPQDDNPESLGDIVVALETLQKECIDQNKSFEHHIQHLIVHGFLHLIGHDHEDDAEAEEMENLEIRILANLGIKNPYEIEENAI